MMIDIMMEVTEVDDLSFRLHVAVIALHTEPGCASPSKLVAALLRRQGTNHLFVPRYEMPMSLGGCAGWMFSSRQTVPTEPDVAVEEQSQRLIRYSRHNLRHGFVRAKHAFQGLSPSIGEI